MVAWSWGILWIAHPGGKIEALWHLAPHGFAALLSRTILYQPLMTFFKAQQFT